MWQKPFYKSGVMHKKVTQVLKVCLFLMCKENIYLMYSLFILKLQFEQVIQEI